MRYAIGAFFGTLIGSFAGLLGVGGGEHRLPVLIGFARLPTRHAIGANLAIGLMTLSVSLVRRALTLDVDDLRPWIGVVVALLVGNVVGALLGARAVAVMSLSRLSLALRVFLIAIGALLASEAFVHFPRASVGTDGLALVLAGVAGVAIGWISGVFGVAGGELRIPLLVFVFAAPIKLAGTMSVIVSLPGVAIALAKHARQGNVPRSTWAWVITIGTGSIVGAIFGVALLPKISDELLHVLLGAVLILAGACLRPHDTVTAPS